MMQKALLLTAQATSSGLVISETATIYVIQNSTVVHMTDWFLLSNTATGVLPLYDVQNKQYLYDTVKLGSYGPYLYEQSTEIHQACAALNNTSVLCTLTGVRPIES